MGSAACLACLHPDGGVSAAPDRGGAGGHAHRRRRSAIPRRLGEPVVQHPRPPPSPSRCRRHRTARPDRPHHQPRALQFHQRALRQSAHGGGSTGARQSFFLQRRLECGGGCPQARIAVLGAAGGRLAATRPQRRQPATAHSVYRPRRGLPWRHARGSGRGRSAPLRLALRPADIPSPADSLPLDSALFRSWQ